MNCFKKRRKHLSPKLLDCIMIFGIVDGNDSVLFICKYTSLLWTTIQRMIELLYVVFLYVVFLNIN